LRIAAAQIKLERGITQAGITRHLYFIEKAIELEADIILFPELSFSGYEPEIAKENLLSVDDERLDALKKLSQSGKITIILGAPTHNEVRPQITAFVICPSGNTRTYSKQHLHDSETKYFSKGTLSNRITIKDTTTTLAICYESKVAEHISQSVNHNPAFHMVSLVEDNIEKSISVLSGYAQKNSLPMIISNCVGLAGGYQCNGGSCYISSNGNIIGNLDCEQEGLLIVNTLTNEVKMNYLNEVFITKSH
jgi:predicted amidohydrolase